jgi:hypothetical protein
MSRLLLCLACLLAASAGLTPCEARRMTAFGEPRPLAASHWPTTSARLHVRAAAAGPLTLPAPPHS